MKTYSIFGVSLVFLVLQPVLAMADDMNQNDVFSRLAGPQVRMDGSIVQQVMNADPGEKRFVDTDNDGKIDTLYFIDTEARHKDIRQPLLVKVVDEDGDMDTDRDGDTDSDIWIADWYGDGSIDRIVDYADLDGDNDVDEQYLYQWVENKSLLSRTPAPDAKRGYLVAWAKDYGDDNRLWYHANYEYGQLITQWKTDFNGDEMFVYLFFFDPERGTLTPIWENAFSFYDLDSDTYSEEVVRFTGNGAMSEDLRYSMDIDNDNSDANRHDFDFSLTGIGPITFRPENCRTVSIRGIETEPIMRWEDMRAVSKRGPWQKIELTWDENDNNIDPRPGQIHNERWEGVLNHANDYMKAVGGPSCGPYNKRNEVDQDGSGALAMYVSRYDRRLHLFGAEIGWIDVDYNYDNTPDMRLSMADTDKDGFFDKWNYDYNNDGAIDRTVTVPSSSMTVLPFEYDSLQDAFLPLLTEAENSNEIMVKSLKQALEILEPDFRDDEVEVYFEETLPGFDPDFAIGKKIVSSREGRRYYYDIIRDRYWYRFVSAASAKKLDGTEIIAAYDNGDYTKASQLLSTLMKKQ